MKERNIPIGWLSPSGEFYECGYGEHLDLSEELIGQIGLNESYLYDEYLLDHGWVHLTMMTFIEHGWNVIFPYNVNRLSYEQHIFLKPYVEENLDFLCDSCKTDLKYEYEDLFL